MVLQALPDARPVLTGDWLSPLFTVRPGASLSVSRLTVRLPPLPASWPPSVSSLLSLLVSPASSNSSAGVALEAVTLVAASCSELVAVTKGLCVAAAWQHTSQLQVLRGEVRYSGNASVPLLPRALLPGATPTSSRGSSARLTGAAYMAALALAPRVLLNEVVITCVDDGSSSSGSSSSGSSSAGGSGSSSGPPGPWPCSAAAVADSASLRAVARQLLAETSDSVLLSLVPPPAAAPPQPAAGGGGSGGASSAGVLKLDPVDWETALRVPPLVTLALFGRPAPSPLQQPQQQLEADETAVLSGGGTRLDLSGTESAFLVAADNMGGGLQLYDVTLTGLPYPTAIEGTPSLLAAWMHFAYLDDPPSTLLGALMAAPVLSCVRCRLVVPDAEAAWWAAAAVCRMTSPSPSPPAAAWAPKVAGADAACWWSLVPYNWRLSLGGGDSAAAYLTPGAGSGSNSNSSGGVASGVELGPDTWRAVRQARVVRLSLAADGNAGRSARLLTDSAIVPHSVYQIWQQQLQLQLQTEGAAVASVAVAAVATSVSQAEAPPVWPLCADEAAYGGCSSQADAAQALQLGRIEAQWRDSRMAMALTTLNPNSGATDFIFPSNVRDAALNVPPDALNVNRSTLDGSDPAGSQPLLASVVVVPRVLAPAFLLAVARPEEVNTVYANTSVTLRGPPPSQCPTTRLYWDLRATTGQVVVPPGAALTLRDMTLYNLYPTAATYEPASTAGGIAAATANARATPPLTGAAKAAAPPAVPGGGLPPGPLRSLTLALWAFQYERGGVGTAAGAAAALSLRNVTLVVPTEELQLLRAALRQLGKLPATSAAAAGDGAGAAALSPARSGLGVQALGSSSGGGGGGGRRLALEAAIAAAVVVSGASDCVSSLLLAQVGDAEVESDQAADTLRLRRLVAFGWAASHLTLTSRTPPGAPSRRFATSDQTLAAIEELMQPCATPPPSPSPQQQAVVTASSSTVEGPGAPSSSGSASSASAGAAPAGDSVQQQQELEQQHQPSAAAVSEPGLAADSSSSSSSAGDAAASAGTTADGGSSSKPTWVTPVAVVVPVVVCLALAATGAGLVLLARKRRQQQQQHWQRDSLTANSGKPCQEDGGSSSEDSSMSSKGRSTRRLVPPGGTFAAFLGRSVMCVLCNPGRGTDMLRSQQSGNRSQQQRASISPSASPSINANSRRGANDEEAQTTDETATMVGAVAAVALALGKSSGTGETTSTSNGRMVAGTAPEAASRTIGSGGGGKDIRPSNSSRALAAAHPPAPGTPETSAPAAATSTTAAAGCGAGDGATAAACAAPRARDLTGEPGEASAVTAAATSPLLLPAQSLPVAILLAQAQLRQELGTDEEDVRLLRVLGMGGAGIVYLGWWGGLQVAVKVVVLSDPEELIPWGHNAAAGPALEDSGRGGGGGCLVAVGTPADLGDDIDSSGGGSGCRVDGGGARRRAMLEAAISAALCGHPNIVATYAYDVQGLSAAEPTAGPTASGATGNPTPAAATAAVLDLPLAGDSSRLDGGAGPEAQRLLLIQELCEGGSLREALGTGAVPGLVRGGAAELSALTLALDTARGLMAVHARGIVHGDVSSSNVLLQRCEAVHPPAWASAAQMAATSPAAATCSESGRIFKYDRGATGETVMVGIAQKHAAAAAAAAAGAMSSSVLGSARPSNCGLPEGGAMRMRPSDPSGWATAPSGPLTTPSSRPSDSAILRASDSGARTTDAVGVTAAAAEAAQLASCRVLAGRWRPPLVAKVADFGLSCRLRSASQTHVSGARQGTPYFQAPELVSSGRGGKAADVFSYGVLLLELIYGAGAAAALERMAAVAAAAAAVSSAAAAASPVSSHASSAAAGALESLTSAAATSAATAAVFGNARPVSIRRMGLASTSMPQPLQSPPPQQQQQQQQQQASPAAKPAAAAGASEVTLIGGQPAAVALPPNAPARLRRLVCACLSLDPKRRPSMQQVVCELTAILDAAHEAQDELQEQRELWQLRQRQQGRQ
ncbi:hypothetical protein HXX76_003147 [Chlamydomonas incerta]|uniref:Protein kinase domain-containing protein n=1 Tax=Chlamydomonas incerta TaxID=51695 RepID=A0A835TMC1_CHLIN|nr:hypothetical protein HXX76_003147 [Chlamydomonas incerta]|eukprot:KAG2441525.1 hypothetical protein HXX76_003147 [Chlamydomonas incerta]